MTTYSHRSSALDKETTYTLKDGYLEISRQGQVSTLNYKDIKKVHIFYMPAYRNSPESFVCHLYPQQSKKIVIKSQDYISFAKFEEKKNQFHNFLIELHKQLSDQTQCIHGAGSFLYYLSLVFLIICPLVMLTAAIILAMQSNFLGLIIVLIASYFIIRSLRSYIKYNKPIKYNPDKIPAIFLQGLSS